MNLIEALKAYKSGLKITHKSWLNDNDRWIHKNCKARNANFHFDELSDESYLDGWEIFTRKLKISEMKLGQKFIYANDIFMKVNCVYSYQINCMKLSCFIVDNIIYDPLCELVEEGDTVKNG